MAITPHLAIIMRVLCTDEGKERVMVLHGTSQPRLRSGEKIADDEIPKHPTPDCFFIESTHPDAIRLGLTKRTYFSKMGVWFGHPKHLRVVGAVSDVLFFELRRVIGDVR